MGKLIILCMIMLLSACSYLHYDMPIPIDGTFSKAQVDAETAGRYQAASEYSANRHGKAVLIIQGYDIVWEQYQNGHRAEMPHHIFSGTKSFAGIMAVAAVADGFLKLDEKVSDTISEFRDDPLKSQITVRQLLNFTSGLHDSFLWLTWDGLLEDQSEENKYAYALTLGMKSAPGTMFRYSSSHLMVFGELMRRKLLGDPLSYLDRRIFQPIGFHYAGWHRDSVGNPLFPYGAWTTAREWAKFGVLVRDQGTWKGVQLLPPKLLADCMVGSELMPAYGLTFWLNHKISEKQAEFLPSVLNRAFTKGYIASSLPSDLIVAAGYQDNRLYIIPSLNLVIVRLGTGDRDFSDYQFLNMLMSSIVNKLESP